MKARAPDAPLTPVSLTADEVAAIEQGLLFITRRCVKALAAPWNSPADVALLREALENATSALRKIRGTP